MLRQQLLVDARLAVEPLGVAGRDQLDQVVPALARLGQQHQVVVVLADRPAAIVPAARRDVHLAAENRLARRAARAWSWNVIAENMLPCSVTATAGMPSDLHLIEQLVDAARAVEQRELGVQVEVDELVIDECGLRIDD